MINAKDVNHSKWTEVTVLFDDDTFSIIWGRYENRQTKSLAMRWNGQPGDDPGYPKLFKNPVWFNIPDWLAGNIFKYLPDKIYEHLDNQYASNFASKEATDAFIAGMEAVREASKEWANQIPGRI